MTNRDIQMFKVGINYRFNWGGYGNGLWLSLATDRRSLHGARAAGAAGRGAYSRRQLLANDAIAASRIAA